MVRHWTISSLSDEMFKWSENLSGQKSSEALLKIINTGKHSRLSRGWCASAGVVCESSVLLAHFLSG